jgi:hypothetical protein
MGRIATMADLTPTLSARDARRAATVVGAAALLALAGCKREPDPEAAVRARFVAATSLAADAGAALRLTSTDEVVFDDGWYPLEAGKDGVHGDCLRWMRKSGLLRLRTHSTAMKLTVTGWVPLDLLGAPPLLTFRWAGKRLDVLLAPGGPFTKELVVTREMQAGVAYGDFTIETSTVAHAPRDERALGFAATEIRWEAVKD